MEQFDKTIVIFWLHLSRNTHSYTIAFCVHGRQKNGSNAGNISVQSLLLLHIFHWSFCTSKNRSTHPQAQCFGQVFVCRKLISGRKKKENVSGYVRNQVVYQQITSSILSQRNATTHTHTCTHVHTNNAQFPHYFQCVLVPTFCLCLCICKNIMEVRGMTEQLTKPTNQRGNERWRDENAEQNLVNR